MAEAKPFASLSSSLLARKGSAKPAMRPQGWGQGMGLEDLGWNDMGGHQPAPAPRQEHVPSPITALTPAPRLGSEAPQQDHAEAAPPPVVEQQRAIAASFTKMPALTPPSPEELEQAEAYEAAPDIAPEPVAELVAESAPVRPAHVSSPPRTPRSAPGSKSKAAFTLRLTAERHLKLRLACAVTHRSAQQIVTDALDQFLSTIPEIEAMAGQVPAKLGKH
jgi:hypothetical protein